MITWMQRHKKYLVVTIWISTIAFVGAGSSLSWGGYDFNRDKAASVAKVGHRTISVQEFQSAYANYYNFYNNLLGGKLTQEQAEQMGLDKLVMNTLINQAFILNYADDLGLLVTKEDVKNRLANTPSYQKNGAFDKDAYYSVLKANHINPNDYEKGLEKEILSSKLESILKLAPLPKEVELFTAAFFMEDRLSISTVTLDASDTATTEEQIKNYWEAHKTKYQTKKSYTLDLLHLPTSNVKVEVKELEDLYNQDKHNYRQADGKIMSFEEAKEQVRKDYLLKLDKKASLETYLSFKKGELKPTETKTYFEDDTSFPLDKIQIAAKDEVLKPFVLDNHYVIVRVKELKFPEPMSYEQAKKEATKDLVEELKVAALDKKAKAKMENFSGSDIGFVSRDTVKSIAGLSEAKSTEFLSHVFDNANKKGYQIIDGKAVVYEILEQKLLNNEKAKQYVSMISENIQQTKQAELNQNLIKKLATMYRVEQFYKGK